MVAGGPKTRMPCHSLGNARAERKSKTTHQHRLRLHQAPEVNDAVVAARSKHGCRPLGQRGAVDGILVRKELVCANRDMGTDRLMTFQKQAHDKTKPVWHVQAQKQEPQ